MPPVHAPLAPHDPVYHPKYGFGTIHSLTRRNRLHPLQEASAADAEAGYAEDYYHIQLSEGGTLLVPVNRADSVGLRRLSSGVEAINACLRSPARSLPAAARERAAELRTREQLPDPFALAQTVRDMLAQSRGRTLATGERAWLEKSCLRLSTEASLVDGISFSEARAAIAEVVREMSVS
jgi:RNA polymerase-interacting CarD/CdnL/TRCF family regulator